MPRHKSILWEIQKVGCSPSYLLGTMHVKDMRAFHRIEEIKGLIDNCLYFYAEMDLAEAQEFNQADFLQMSEDKNLRQEHLFKKNDIFSKKH